MPKTKLHKTSIVLSEETRIHFMLNSVKEFFFFNEQLTMKSEQWKFPNA